MEYIEKYVNKCFTAQYKVDGSVSVLLVFHGLLESTERYAELAEYLSSYGVSVVVFDMPGHGRTLATETGVFNKCDVLDSMDLMYSYVGQNYQGVPIVVLAHSMGSFYFRLWSLEHHDVYAVLSGTGNYPNIILGFCTTAVRILGSKSVDIASYLASLRFLSFKKYAWISRDVQEVDKFPVYDIRIDKKSLKDLLNVITSVNHKYCPALYISGCKDVIGCGLSGFDNVVKFPGARHELLHETNRYEVFEQIRKEIMFHSEH